MAHISADVFVFDPVMPSRRIQAKVPGFDSWHAHTLITAEVRRELHAIPSVGTGTLSVSSGMTVVCEQVEIGIRIGSIHIDRLRVLVVDKGSYDILLGQDVLEHVFRLGNSNTSNNVRVSSPEKDDPTALAIELYPLRTPVDLFKFERFIHAQRILHNLALVSLGEFSHVAENSLNALIDEDSGIPEAMRLRLAWIDNGSIWLTLRSGSQSALRYVARVFQTGTTADFVDQEKKSRDNSSEHQNVATPSRESVADRLRLENERLHNENLPLTYDTWREEVRKDIELMDEVISQVRDPVLISQLLMKRDQAIATLLEQQILPVVRNIPRQPDIPADRKWQLLLSAGDDNNDNEQNSMKKTKILFLAANPLDTDRLALDEEIRDIALKLRAAEHRDVLELKPWFAVRADDLQQALLEETPTVVHFSGHGTGAGGIVLQGPVRAGKLVTGNALRSLFSTLKDSIRLIVFNACYSEEQATSLVEVIDFVVGMKASIGDTAARVFAASFYRGIGFGRSVGTAFKLGLSAIKLEGLVLDEDIPVLLCRTGMDPHTTRIVGAGP